MLTNTHAIAWSGDKGQQGQHNKAKKDHDKFSKFDPLNLIKCHE
jgi:hypothetical protein